METRTTVTRLVHTRVNQTIADKAAALWNGYRIVWSDKHATQAVVFLSGTQRAYRVDVKAVSCTCPAGKTGGSCKHIVAAVALWNAVAPVAAQPTPALVLPFAPTCSGDKRACRCFSCTAARDFAP